MYKIMAFLSRKPGMSREDFREYYENQHAPLVEQLTPKMASYSRNYITLGGPLNRDEHLIHFDVITEMVFVDKAACDHWVEAYKIPETLARISADEEEFLDLDRVLVSEVDCEKSS